MFYALPYKTKQFFYVLIKLSIVTAAFCFIYQKLTNNVELSFSDFLSKNTILSLKNTTFLLFLTFLNWFFEILKWQTLVSSIKPISFKNALEQCLGSLTVSLLTPNRIGEYGAKAIYYKSEYRKKIMLINLISNSSQMAITILLGVVGLSFFISKYNLNLNYHKLLLISLIVLLIVISTGFIIKKFNFKIKGFSFAKIKAFILNFPKDKLALSLFLSFIKYAIFSFQFYYLLTIFKIDIDYQNAMIIITTIYLLASIIPTVFIFDVVIKGSVAVFLFSFLGFNLLTIINITTLMWILNFVLPSVIGSYYVLRFKLPKSKI